MDHIETGVRETVASTLGVEADSLAPDTDLVTGLDADSLSLADLGIALEERFGVEIPDEVAEGVRTLADLVACVRRVAVGRG